MGSRQSREFAATCCRQWVALDRVPAATPDNQVRGGFLQAEKQPRAVLQPETKDQKQPQLLLRWQPCGIVCG